MERFEVKRLWMKRPWLYIDHVLDSFTVVSRRYLARTYAGQLILSTESFIGREGRWHNQKDETLTP
jgi:hypothetical protein